jgi:sigma-E factor negative regulatory protein RseA
MEQVSTFMDGELNVDAGDREIATLKSDAVAREVWDTYHLIGDAMRGSVPAMPGFAARFSARLEDEPTVLAPHARTPRKMQTYALSAAASVAAVAVVGWMGYGVMKTEVPPVQVAKAPAAALQQPKPALTAPAPIVSVPAQHVHEYMLAHSGISPTTQIQGVTNYIRTVSASDE